MYKRSYVILSMCGILTGVWVGSAVGWTNTGGGDHGGADWIIDGPSVEIAGIHTGIDTIRIPNGDTVLVKAYESSDYGYVEIHAAVIDIAGTLQGSKRGGDRDGEGESDSDGGGGGDTGEKADPAGRDSGARAARSVGNTERTEFGGAPTAETREHIWGGEEARGSSWSRLRR